MKKISIITASLFLLTLFAAPALLAGGEAHKADKMGEKSAQAMLQKGKQGVLMQTDHLIGTDVQNQQGKKVGEIENVILDIERGQIAYVIVTGGGVIGLGDEEYIVPFNALKAPNAATQGEKAAEQQMFTLTTDKEKLRELPEGDIFTTLDQNEGSQIHQYYGVSPYWEQGLIEPFEPNPDD